MSSGGLLRMTQLSDETFETIADAARVGGCRLLSVPRLWQAEHLQPSFVWVHGQPLVELTSPSLKGQQLFWKRLLDLFGAAVGLVVLSPETAAHPQAQLRSLRMATSQPAINPPQPHRPTTLTRPSRTKPRA